MRKTVNMYLETLDENQIVVIYDDKHNIHWVERAGYAPLNCWFEFRNAVRKGNEMVINGVI